MPRCPPGTQTKNGNANHRCSSYPPPPPPPPDFSGGPRKLKTISLYAAAMALGIILFFTLHYIGNGIPYDLARQRFAEEFAAHQTADGAARYFGGERPLFNWEFCDISVKVMAGARRDSSGNPLVDAIRLKNFRIKVKPGEAGPAGGFYRYYCAVLYAASGGAELFEFPAKPRYWWGSKAALSILLRFLSVYDIHQLILIATYMAWALLAASLLLMGWRTLLTVAPLLILGALFSGVGYFADITNGLPYLWILLAASALALLLLRPRTARWAPLFCFITGMVSAYLWFFDGHTALAMVLIGLIAWLGYARLKRSAPIRRAAACLALYLAAFALCIALGQGVKVAVVEWATDYSGWGIARGFFQTVSDRLGRTGAETVAGITGDETVAGITGDETVAGITGDETVAGITGDETVAGITGDETAVVKSCPGCGAAGWQWLPIIRDIRGYWMMLPFGLPAGNLLNAYSALALAAAVAVAIRRARWGKQELGRGLLWLGALALLASVHFFLPNDTPFRNARFAFLLLAICWIALALAVPRMNRRTLTATAATAAAGIAAAIGLAAYWHLDANRVIAQIPPVISADFDVYHSNGQLTYIKEDCNRADTRTMFFLHLTPHNADDLPHERRELGFDNLDFSFQERRRWVLGKCVAEIGLPDYDIAYISTGQYIYDAGTVWGGKFPLDATDAALESARAEYAAAAAGTLLARGVFDVYRDGNRLTYIKESCRAADTQPRFYLHLTPWEVSDLPSSRRGYGFDSVNFELVHHGALFDGKCLATVELPHYNIATVKTGQFTSGGGNVWGVEFALDVPNAVLESRRAEYAAVTAGTPLTSGVFDIYRDGNRLTYIKEICRPADTQPRFYLHLIPRNVNDLPLDRRQHGFDNLNFDFVDQGTLFDGKCLATVELPDYEIAAIQTGQYIPGESRIWQAEFPYR